jgi:cell division protease FtsH
MSKKPKNKSYSNIFVYIFCVIVLIILLLQGVTFEKNKMSEDSFFHLLSAGKIKKILIKHKESAIFELHKNFFTHRHRRLFPIRLGSKHNCYEFDIGDLVLFQKKIQDYKKLYNLNTSLEFYNKQDYSLMKFIIDYGLFFLFILIIYFIFFRKIGNSSGSQLFNIGKSKAKLFDENDNVKITFKNVAGLEEAKEEIQEIVDFLKNPNKYTKLGGKIPKGALLIGPPGTGKTLLAKAVAGEAKVPFFSLAGPDFVEMFVGVGASRVRDLFERAKDKSPCIIFIDEIDAIGRARGKNYMNGGANDERESTLNQLLTEMDGFSTNMQVIVMAATNRADILDKALLRPGRFDRTIIVDLPELNERKDIFKVHLKNIILSNSVNIDFLSKQTPGFSGADIANVCNEAALIAARKDKEQVDCQDFLDAIDRIVGGLEKKSKIIKPHEKKRIATHEIGHAMVSWFLEYAAPLIKVTIVPRGRYLGAAWYLPEERQLTTIDHMLDEICSLLGGRAAEFIVFNSVSTGALNDLERVTKQAHAIVTIFGLNDKIGNVSYYDSTNIGEMYLAKPYSEKTAQVIDDEIFNIIDVQYKRAIKILTDNKIKLLELSDKLLDKEVIFADDLEAILGAKNVAKDRVID